MGKSNVGTTISITSEIPVTRSLTHYGELEFVKIGGVIYVGEYGDSCEEVQFSYLETGRKITVKGKVSGGLFEVAYIPDLDDDGQSIVESAYALDANYSFKVSRSDGLEEFFQGRVMKNNYAKSESSSVMQKVFSVEINTEVPDGRFPFPLIDAVPYQPTSIVVYGEAQVTATAGVSNTPVTNDVIYAQGQTANQQISII